MPGGVAVAILSHAFWQRVFHGDPALLGRTIGLRGEEYTVVGIMPRDFRAASPVDVWTPLRPSRKGEGGGSNYEVIARLRPGVSLGAGERSAAIAQPGAERRSGLPSRSEELRGEHRPAPDRRDTKRSVPNSC